MDFDIQKCFILLDINLNETELTKINHEFIKKKYHKMALKWHPDKNKNLDPIFVKEKFQQINEAYAYLCKEFDNEMNFHSNTNNLFVSSYINLLSLFISNIINGNYKDIIIDILQNLLDKTQDNTFIYIKDKFENMDKELVLEIYRLLFRYKDIFHIHSDFLEFVSLLVKEKYKNNQIYIINPSIYDIMNNNIYKLYVGNNLYLVPLWHSELYFDNFEDKENDIIVLCHPILPDNITIDENNNLIYELVIDFKNELFKQKYIDFTISNKQFNIPIEKLFIKEEQYYTLKNQGISKLNETNIYNVENKDDIIVKIKFH
jgi:hypothetical protein